MVIQFGLSLVMPVLLCIAFCYWLCSSFGIGSWIYIPGILFGLVSSGVTGYRFYQAAMRMHRKKDRPKKTVSFNDHL